MSRGLKHILAFTCHGFGFELFNPRKSDLYNLLKEMDYDLDWSDAKESMTKIVLEDRRKIRRYILEEKGDLGLDVGKKYMEKEEGELIRDFDKERRERLEEACFNLNISTELEKDIIDLLGRVEEENIGVGHAPSSIVGGCIYTVLKAKNNKKNFDITQRDIVKALNSSLKAIKLINKKIEKSSIDID